MPIAPGTKIGPYEIISPLGEGGMGAVYQAHDPTLQRTVAIKVLAKQDEDASARLLQEARAASALNHPHICTIHEVGEHEGQAFIVMEHVEGKPLSALIPSDGLPPESVIRYGTQIADALAHAHERGIVHRDLKSQNVVITPEGRAKVLDFGLAARMPSADAEAVTKTQEAIPHAGMLVGTLAYMAPEVLRGDAATARSDIWALGVLLYEMASGRLPFEGETALDVTSAIAKESPRALPSRVSAGFRSVVQRCLQKEPGSRYSAVVAVQSALETIQSDTGTQQASIAPVGATRTWRAAAAVIGLVLVAGVIGYWLRPGPETSAFGVPRLANPVQITSAVGEEVYPAWSPDGQMLAYESNQAGNWDIWVVQPGSSQPVNRTADHAGVDRSPSWSPDGNQLAFLSDRDGNRGVFVMSPLGGAPRKLGTFSGRVGDGDPIGLQWLADGTALATKVGATEGPLDETRDESDFFAEILVVATGEARRVPLPGRRIDRHELQWSSDELYLAYLDTSSPRNEVTQLWVLHVVDGEARALTDGRTRDLSPTWSSDSKTLYYVSNRGGSLDLWQQPMDGGIPAGDPERVTVGVGMQSATFSPDGTRLAYVRGGNLLGNLWRVPIFDARAATWADAEQLTFDEASIDAVDVSSDGERVVFNSERSGNQDLWVLPAAGGELQQLTTEPTPDWSPRWSPDDQQIAFYSARSGSRDIWVMPATGGTARQLTTHEATDAFPAWSPDGTAIAFNSNRNGNSDIWIMPVEGGEPRQVTDDRAADFGARFSPDGRWLSFQRQGAVWRVPTAGGESERLTDGGNARWAPDSQQVYLRRTTEGQMNVWVVSLANGAARQVTDLSDNRPGALRGRFATDGDYVYFTWVQNKGDIWVMDVVQDDGSDD